MNRLIQVLSDGKLSDDVFFLAGPFALANAARTHADLLKFLKVTKGVRGRLALFTDQACTAPLTPDNYAALRESLVGRDLFFTADAAAAAPDADQPTPEAH